MTCDVTEQVHVPSAARQHVCTAASGQTITPRKGVAKDRQYVTTHSTKRTHLGGTDRDGCAEGRAVRIRWCLNSLEIWYHLGTSSSPSISFDENRDDSQ